MNEKLSSIKNIGPFLENAFKTRSYWPPDSNTLRPIRSVKDLISFVKTRGSIDKAETKRKLSLWLKSIMKNIRSGECIGKTVKVNGQDSQYKVRKSNLEGYNSIISFLRDSLDGTLHYDKIPNKLPYLTGTRKYPCKNIR